MLENLSILASTQENGRVGLVQRFRISCGMETPPLHTVGFHSIDGMSDLLTKYCILLAYS